MTDDLKMRLANARAKLTTAEGDFRNAAARAASGSAGALAALAQRREDRDKARRHLEDVEAEAADAPPEPEPAPTGPTLEAAILSLAAAKQFRPADIGVGHAAAARLKVGVALGPDTARRLHRLLADYRTELAGHGIDYAAITPPPDGGPAAAPPKTAARGPIGRSRVWVTGGHLWLKVPYSRGTVDLIHEQIPAAVWDKKVLAWKLPPTPMAALSIANALGQFGVDADDAATTLIRAAHVARDAGAKRSAVDLPPVPGSKTEAWNHQKQAFWFARELPGAILDMEMGTGKSKVTVDLIHDSRAESVMIVCPERVVGVWPKQFGIHSGGEKHIVDPRYQTRRGEWKLLPIAKRVEMYEHALHECDCGLPHILISNYSAAGHEPFKSWSLRQHFDYLAYDECHRLRSHNGVWSQWAKKMHAHADRRLGGTGTLQAQSPLDVFGQARAVEPGVFGTTYIGFEKRYAVKGGYGGYKVLDYQNEDELAEKLASFTYHAGEEVLDLPEMLPDVDVTGQMSARAWEAYVAFEQDMYAEVARTLADGSTVLDEASADNVLVKLLRCQQMTGGALPLDSGEVEEIDTAKADLLFEELSDIDPREPVVVFCRFLHDLDKVRQVAERLDDNRGRRYGELSGRRGDALAADATLAVGIQVAGVQIQAGGTGVDFTRSAFGIYYSVGHSLSDYLQSRKRLHRPGQHRSTRFRHLIMEGTIDEDVYAALEARQSVVQRISDKVRAIQRRAS